MMYLWLKAFHIAAAMIWIGGILVASIVIAALPAPSGPQSDTALRIVRAARQWDLWATLPAMLLVWALGLMLAMVGHWFPSPWLMLKLPGVLALSALHGVLSGTLRRRAGGGDQGPPPPALLRYAALIVPPLVLAIAILAVAKPL